MKYLDTELRKFRVGDFFSNKFEQDFKFFFIRVGYSIFELISLNKFFSNGGNNIILFILDSLKKCFSVLEFFEKRVILGDFRCFVFRKFGVKLFRFLIGSSIKVLVVSDSFIFIRVVKQFHR